MKITVLPEISVDEPVIGKRQQTGVNASVLGCGDELVVETK